MTSVFDSTSSPVPVRMMADRTLPGNDKPTPLYGGVIRLRGGLSFHHIP
jgi:hypothetical protein